LFERKKQEGESVDEVVTKAGELPEGQTPPEEKPTSDERLYTKEERDQYASNKLAEAGRKHKTEITERETKLGQATTRLKELEDQLEDLQTNGVKEPDAKAVFELKKQVRKERAEVLEAKASLQSERDSLAADKAEIEKGKLVRRASAIAAKYEGEDFEDLIDMTGGSDEQMEELAKKLGKPKEEKAKGPVPAKLGSPGAMTDAAFWKAAAEEPGKYDSPADMKRLQEISKRMNGG